MTQAGGKAAQRPVARAKRASAKAGLARSPWIDGWHSAARRVPSPNFGVRPAGFGVELAIVHSISLPPGQYGGNAIERFFCNTLDWSEHPYFDTIRDMEVSSHFFVRRDGELVQFVSVEDRAWHAGASSWRGRGNCNDYSVGIELEGLEGSEFDPRQYTTLARLLRDCRAHWPIREVLGHEHVAPGRKGDPGAGFDWALLKRRLRWTAPYFATVLASGRAG